MLRSLEWESLPPNPVPSADAIVVLSGGTLPRLSPRPTVEVSDGGDRDLLRGRAVPSRSCPSGDRERRCGHRRHRSKAGVGRHGGIARDRRCSRSDDRGRAQGHEHPRPRGLPMSDVPGAEDHPGPAGHQRDPHAPRAWRISPLCGTVDYTPAPTDFRSTVEIPSPWYRHVVNLLPTSRAFLDFSDAAHEYLGSCPTGPRLVLGKPDDPQRSRRSTTSGA